MDEATPAQAIGPARDRSGDFDPITSGDVDWLWPGLNESRAPATVRSDQGLGAEGAADTPVLARQELNQALPPRLEGCFLQFCWRVLPIDLLDNQKVSGIDVQTFGSTQVREIAALDVCLKAMSGDLRHTFDAVERPAPALVGMEAQVVQAAMDSVGRSMEVASKLPPRNQADAFTEVPVLQFAPRLLAASDIDTRRRPGLSERVKVPEDAVQRRIRSSRTRTTALLTMPTGEFVPLLSRSWGTSMFLEEATKPRDHSLPSPPGTPGRTPRPKREHKC